MSRLLMVLSLCLAGAWARSALEQKELVSELEQLKSLLEKRVQNEMDARSDMVGVSKAVQGDTQVKATKRDGVSVGEPIVDEKHTASHVKKRVFQVPNHLLKKRQEVPDTCVSPYTEMDASTMCNYNVMEGVDLSKSVVTPSNQQLIVDLHNTLRSQIGSYSNGDRDASTQPACGDCVKMIWDDEIAVIAQHYANACPTVSYLAHDENAERRVPGWGISIGQNLAWGYPTWTQSIQAGWYDEVFDYQFGVTPSSYIPQGSSVQIGHYTQMVWAPSIRIGCGYAECLNNGYTGGHTYVCNYAFQQSDMASPYEAAAQSCTACPNTCNNGLCDCGGRICFNGGTLDLATCSCSCEGIYIGDSCETLNCPADDPSYCGQNQPYGYPSSFCDVYSNVPFECPFMCGLCPGDSDPTTSAAPATDAPTTSSTEAPTTPSTSLMPTTSPATDAPTTSSTEAPTTPSTSLMPTTSTPPPTTSTTPPTTAAPAPATTKKPRKKCRNKWWCKAYFKRRDCNVYCNIADYCPRMCGCPAVTNTC